MDCLNIEDILHILKFLSLNDTRNLRCTSKLLLNISNRFLNNIFNQFKIKFKDFIGNEKENKLEFLKRICFLNNGILDPSKIFIINSTVPRITNSWYNYNRENKIEITIVSSQKIKELWLRKNLMHREDGPAWTEWVDSTKKIEGWFLNNYNHRIGGSAKKEWHSNGQIKFEEWYKYSKLYRIDGPSYNEWYKNGNKRRESWFINYRRHRLDKPAVAEWYENGKKKYQAWYLKMTNFIEKTVQLQ